MPNGTLGERFNFVLQERHCSVILETSQGEFHPQKEPLLALLAFGPKNGSKTLLKSSRVD